ncbi:MAG: VCBS repeat-containing protein, partial [Melioribacteraceae bacterium]|nr:VCBS repeat-containing protein [Melioribacteraceae bacterium]
DIISTPFANFSMAVHWFENRGNMEFSESESLIDNIDYRDSIRVHDYNNDGYDDILYSQFANPTSIYSLNNECKLLN